MLWVVQAFLRLVVARFPILAPNATIAQPFHDPYPYVVPTQALSTYILIPAYKDTSWCRREKTLPITFTEMQMYLYRKRIVKGEESGGSDNYLGPPGARAQCAHQLSCWIQTSIYIAWDAHILRKHREPCYADSLDVLLTLQCCYFHNTIVQCCDSQVKHIFLL